MATPRGYVRVKEQVPFSGIKGVDNVLVFLKKLLTENPYTQKFTVEVGNPFIRLEKYVREEHVTSEQRGLPLHELVRTRPLEEYVPEKGATPHSQLLSMCDVLAKQELWANCILTPDLGNFNRWVGLPIKRTAVLGLPTLVVPELPADVFMVCGAAERAAEPDELDFSVMGRLP